MARAKEIDGLDCEASATVGVKLLLQSRLAEMCGLREGALNWSDIEGVHDMRVASRRLRSALRDFKPFLKQRKYRQSSEAIKRIADALGTVRDKDVAIAALEKLAASAPPDVAPGIEQFAEDRRLVRARDRIALVDAVADDRILSLREDIDTVLEAASVTMHEGKQRPGDERVEVTFRAAGHLIVKARIEELRQFSTSLYQPHATKPLHRMRISTKRLRYAIELFGQCWDTQIESFSKEVAEMQTSLGELHDCDVWMAEFGGLLRNQNVKQAVIDAAEEVDTDTQKRHSSVWLLGHFTKKRTNHYRDALARWHDWESSDFFARLETCIQRLPPGVVLLRAGSVGS